MIDDELCGASEDLRQAVERVAIPPFEPPSETTKSDGLRSVSGASSSRRKTSFRVLGIAASVAVVVAGTFAAFRLSETQETNAAGRDVSSDSVEPVVDSDISWQGGITDNRQVDEVELAEPQAGETVIDPAFGTSIEAVGNGSTSSSLLPLQGRPAWNADGSYLLMYRSGSGFSLFDSETLTEVRVIPISPADIEQVYWHPTNPELLYFVDHSDDEAVYLRSFNVETSSMLTVHTYRECSSVSGVGSRRISAGTLLIGQLCTGPEGSFIVSVNVETSLAIRQPAGDFGAPQPTPTSGRFVVRTPEGVAHVLDNQLLPTGVEFFVGDDPMVVIETDQGQELLVTTVFSGEADQIGSIVAFDLADGSSTVIVGPSTGYPFPPAVGGIGTSLAGDGRVVFATDADPNQPMLTGEIMIVDFDVASPIATRIVHHRSTGQNAADISWSEAYPSLHPTQPAVIFASDWDGTHSSPFIVTG